MGEVDNIELKEYGKKIEGLKEYLEDEELIYEVNKNDDICEIKIYEVERKVEINIKKGELPMELEGYNKVNELVEHMKLYSVDDVIAGMEWFFNYK